MLVSIDSLVENSYNPNRLSPIKFKALVKSIKEENGNRLFPIEVLPEKDGKYIVIDGAHRTRALKEAGIKVAHIEVSSLKNGYEKLRTLSKNKIHGEHDEVLEMELIKSIKEAGISEKEIISSLGMTEIELAEITRLMDVEMPIEDEDIGLYEEEEEVIKPKKCKVNCSEAQLEIFKSLSKETEIEDIATSLCLIANYFKLLSEEDMINEDVLKIAKEKTI